MIVSRRLARAGEDDFTGALGSVVDLAVGHQRCLGFVLPAPGIIRVADFPLADRFAPRQRRILAVRTSKDRRIHRVFRHENVQGIFGRLRADAAWK